MILSPQQARKLADALLTGGDDDTDLRDSIAGWAPQGEGEPGRFGRYRVVRLVGHGGMGEVYEARQDHPERRVALKVVRPDFVSPELIRRLDHEARMLARLQHPGIAQIYDAGQVETPRGSTSYFAMEFVEGRPLTAFAKQEGLGLRDRLTLFLAVCDAVEHAHRKGVIHRDLKPGNILVDAEGKPRVLDFGVARATDADVRATSIHTDVGKLIGTLPYMSPEQVSGDPDATDTRSDVYSLGVVFYELLAGKPPYDIGRGPIPEAARIIRDTDPAPLSSVDRVFRGDLETIAAKALEKDKERRYQSVAALASDVRRHLNNEPIEARRTSALDLVTRWARRKRAAAIAVALTTLMLVGATVVSTYWSFRERSALRKSQRSEAQAIHETATSRAVVDFLVEVITLADPAKAGRELRLVAAVEQASELVERRFADRPAVRAELHARLAYAFRALAVADKAEHHARTALELFTRQNDPENPRALEAMCNLAGVLDDQGRAQEASATYQRAIEAMTRVLGESHPDTLAAQNNYASFLGDRDQVDEAIRRYTSLVAVLEKSAGPDSQATRVALGNMAKTMMYQGRYPEAEPILRRVLDSCVRTLGTLHPDTLSSRCDVASCLLQQRRLDEVESVMHGLDEEIERVFGPDHPETQAVLQTRATLHRRQGRLEEAEPLFRRVLASAIRTHPPGHQALPTFRLDLGSCLLDLKRFDEAETLFLEALEATPDYGESHPLTVATHRALFRLYDRWGKPDQAAEWRAKLPLDDPARSAPAPVVPAPVPGG